MRVLSLMLGSLLFLLVQTVQAQTLTACTTAGAQQYSGGEMQFCDGTYWVNMSGKAAGSSGNGSCAGTTAGTQRFSSSKMQFCDGTNWYDMVFVFYYLTAGSGSFSVPAGYTSLRVHLWGAGGSGGSGGEPQPREPAEAGPHLVRQACSRHLGAVRVVQPITIQLEPRAQRVPRVEWRDPQAPLQVVARVRI